MIASDYHICGRVNIDASDAKIFSSSKRVVVLHDRTKGGDRRATTDENGDFCFEVKPGQYTVQPVVNAEEKEKGLRLIPAEKQVTVDGQPILNVNFT